MGSEPATELLERNAAHVASLASRHFEAVKDGQEPSVVSVCCSDSRVSQEGMFDSPGPGWLFTPSNIGNQTRDRIVVDGEVRTVVDGSILYPLVHTGTQTAAVVGHTRCGAVTTAYDQVTDAGVEPPGIQALIDALAPIVADGLDEGVVDADATRARVIDELVEYNVDRQVAFISESDDVPAETTVYGFVYDFHGSYGGPDGRLYLVNADGDRDDGRLYLVNADGDRDVDTLRNLVDDEVSDQVSRLTEY